MASTPDSHNAVVHDGLVVHDLSRRFGPRWVLARVGFDVPPGDALLVVGHNGCGKTTLLRCLATALKIHHGSARFGGLDMWENRAELRHKVALLSHDSHLYEDLSARQNLDVWAKMGGLHKDLDALLERVGLEHTGKRPVRAFSAGMRRRLALARVLLKDPSLILFDEPFSALDPAGRATVAGVLQELRERGATILLSTHHHEIGARFADQAMRMKEGRIVWKGPSHELLSSGGHP